MDHFRIENLSISFGGLKAVNNVSFNVEPNTIFSIIGPNGSGKTTTLKLMLGLLHPTKGRVAVFGKHPRMRSVRQRLGYLPEETPLYPFLTGAETAPAASRPELVEDPV